MTYSCTKNAEKNSYSCDDLQKIIAMCVRVKFREKNNNKNTATLNATN